MKFPHHRWIWPPQVKLCRGYRNIYKEVYDTVLKAVSSRLQSNRTDRQMEQWADRVRWNLLREKGNKIIQPQLSLELCSLGRSFENVLQRLETTCNYYSRSYQLDQRTKHSEALFGWVSYMDILQVIGHIWPAHTTSMWLLKMPALYFFWKKTESKIRTVHKFISHQLKTENMYLLFRSYLGTSG